MSVCMVQGTDHLEIRISDIWNTLLFDSLRITCVNRRHMVMDIDAKGQNTLMSAEQKQQVSECTMKSATARSSLSPALSSSSMNKR